MGECICDGKGSKFDNDISSDREDIIPQSTVCFSLSLKQFVSFMRSLFVPTF